MNIHDCRRGHRQRAAKTSVRGLCQPYSGHICSQQLPQQSVFVRHKTHQAVTEKLLAGKRHLFSVNMSSTADFFLPIRHSNVRRRNEVGLVLFPAECVCLKPPLFFSDLTSLLYNYHGHMHSLYDAFGVCVCVCVRNSKTIDALGYQRVTDRRTDTPCMPICRTLAEHERDKQINEK